MSSVSTVEEHAPWWPTGTGSKLVSSGLNLQSARIVGMTMLSNADLCGDCIHFTGEECDGPGGSREGSEVYSDTPACDCYDEKTGD